MISIIICSVSKSNLQRLRNSIDATTGLTNEIIVYDNREKRGLCWVYNACAAKAKNDYLCFVHEDVIFHLPGWDERIVEHLKDADTGLIGVMGGRYKSAFGLGWRDGKTDFYRYRLKDGLMNGKQLYFNPENENTSQVVCVDGVFLCCRKDIWAMFRFDENTFSGFHFYDIDFSFRIARHYKNYVANTVLLEHFSHGNIGKEYLAASLLFDKRHREFLPFTLETLSNKEISQLEGYALSEKLQQLRKNGFPLFKRIQLLRRYVQRHHSFYQLIRNLYFGFLKKV